jgi:hypothetical protein
MEVGQGPNWGCSAKEKKSQETEHYQLAAQVTRVDLGVAFPEIRDLLPVNKTVQLNVSQSNL